MRRAEHLGRRFRAPFLQLVQRGGESGSDDEAELLQDGLVMALQFLRSANASGKAVTAGTLAYYALKHLRGGRRSTGCRRTDPLHAAAQLSHRSRVYSLEEPMWCPRVSEEPLTLGEVLASAVEDPASEAGRKLDWDWVSEQLDEVARAILCCLASGENLMVLVSRLGRSRSALQHHKELLARLIQDWLGDPTFVIAPSSAGAMNGLEMLAAT